MKEGHPSYYKKIFDRYEIMKQRQTKHLQLEANGIEIELTLRPD